MRRIRLWEEDIALSRRRILEPKLLAEVSPLIDDVLKRGDAALLAQRERFDHVRGTPLRLEAIPTAQARGMLTREQRQAMETTINRLRAFAGAQMAQLTAFELETGKGCVCGQRPEVVDAAAVYVPAGRYPLPSSLMMGVVPAQVAGVKRIAVFSPPRFGGGVHPMILAAASLLGVEEIYALGGVAAIAAAAYGTESIPPVDVIVGPGNRYVTAAKKLVFGDVGIDALAGPSELLLLADDRAPVSWMAADLLAQAEHDPEARVFFFCQEEGLVDALEGELDRQLGLLPDPEPARSALREHARAVIFRNAEAAVRAINRLAPEHLQLMVAKPDWWEKRLRHFGSLFIGPYSVEALGDYCAGPNHTLPTGRSARFSSGLSVRNFVKLSTTLRFGREGMARLAPTAMTLAEMEGLMAHRNSLACRLEGQDF